MCAQSSWWQRGNSRKLGYCGEVLELRASGQGGGEASKAWWSRARRQPTGSACPERGPVSAGHSFQEQGQQWDSLYGDCPLSTGHMELLR